MISTPVLHFSSLTRLETPIKGLKISNKSFCGFKRSPRMGFVTAATYNPSFDFGSHEESYPFSGVLHSSKLPPSLSENIGVYDARDAIEACSGLWGDEKETCYAIFGVSPEADLYFDIVYKLETALELDTQPEEDARHRGQERC